MGRGPIDRHANLVTEWFRETPNLAFQVTADRKLARWWDQHVYRPFALTPQMIADIVTEGLPFRPKVTLSSVRQRANSFTIDVAGSPTEVQKVTYLAAQSLNLGPADDPQIEIGAAMVIDELQGRGINTILTDNVRRLALLMRLPRLTVDAYLEAGPYVWASYGFVPNQEDWLRIRKQILHRFVDQLDLFKAHVDQPILSQAFAILMSDDPKAILAVSTLRQMVHSRPFGDEADPREVTLGRALLADSGLRWYGVLDFDDRQSMEFFDDSVRRNRNGQVQREIEAGGPRSDP